MWLTDTLPQQCMMISHHYASLTGLRCLQRKKGRKKSVPYFEQMACLWRKLRPLWAFLSRVDLIHCVITWGCLSKGNNDKWLLINVTPNNLLLKDISTGLSLDVPDFLHCRVILTVWGVITIVVGAFIFGQSTTIAVMELCHKFWISRYHITTTLSVAAASLWLHSAFCTTEKCICKGGF